MNSGWLSRDRFLFDGFDFGGQPGKERLPVLIEDGARLDTFLGEGGVPFGDDLEPLNLDVRFPEFEFRPTGAVTYNRPFFLVFNDFEVVHLLIENGFLNRLVSLVPVIVVQDYFRIPVAFYAVLLAYLFSDGDNALAVLSERVGNEFLFFVALTKSKNEVDLHFCLDEGFVRCVLLKNGLSKRRNVFGAFFVSGHEFTFGFWFLICTVRDRTGAVYGRNKICR